jgi:hypothetical protein
MSARFNLGTRMSGPIRSTSTNSGNGKQQGRSKSVTIAALGAAATGTYTIADSDARLGDVICVSPAAAMEAGAIIASARVSVNGTIEVRIVNASASSLVGGAMVLFYTISA